MPISFMTPTMIDLLTIKTFGVSVKESENPIGFFGTGMKYAIATLLRTGHKVTMWRGLEEFKFELKDTSIRDKDIPLVLMNGEPLPFTSDLGKTWLVWQAYRELHSNVMDEKGYTTSDTLSPAPNCTLFVVEGHEIERIYQDRNAIFCDNEIIEENESIQVRRGESGHIYYRGIRVYDIAGNKAKYTYNIKSKLDLTEDRTVKYEYMLKHELTNGIIALTNRDLISDIITSPRLSYEGEMKFDFNRCSPEFEEECLKQFKNSKLNNTLWAWLIRNAKAPLDNHELSEFKKEAVNKAIEYAEKMGFQVRAYPIMVSTLPRDVVGMAAHGKILISERAIEEGMAYLVQTLIEEYIHLRYDVYDHTRAMQEVLLKHLVRLGAEAQRILL